MSARLQVNLDFGVGSTPLLLGECLWVSSERVAAFQWSDDAIASGFLLSPFMPLQAKAIKAGFQPFDGLHGIFSDSIPDGFGLRLMNQALAALGYLPGHVNPLHRLAWVGQRGVGALTFTPAIDGAASRELMGLAQIAGHARRAQLENLQDLPKSAIKAGGSALGARPKFWADISEDGQRIILGDAAVSTDGFVPSLLKFAPARGDQNEPFYEAACLSLAQTHGIRAARGQLLHHPQGAALAVERFDRTAAGERIFTQSVAALLNADFRTPCLDYSALAVLSAKLSGVAETERIFRQVCFNVALSMRDDHCKNFAFCMDKTGKWELSPAFDLCPSEGPGGWHTTTVSGEGQTITRDHLLRFAKSMKLPPTIAEDSIEHALAAASEFGSLAVSLGATKAGCKKWTKRFKEIAKQLRAVSVPGRVI